MLVEISMDLGYWDPNIMCQEYVEEKSSKGEKALTQTLRLLL